MTISIAVKILVKTSFISLPAKLFILFSDVNFYLFTFQYYANEMSRVGGRREGWGSAEATEMVLNNLFYVTAKVIAKFLKRSHKTKPYLFFNAFGFSIFSFPMNTQKKSRNYGRLYAPVGLII